MYFKTDNFLVAKISMRDSPERLQIMLDLSESQQLLVRLGKFLCVLFLISVRHISVFTSYTPS